MSVIGGFGGGNMLSQARDARMSAYQANDVQHALMNRATGNESRPEILARFGMGKQAELKKVQADTMALTVETADEAVRERSKRGWAKKQEAIHSGLSVFA